ncbi:hypothetical protein [Clostridium lacusfryxellense]|uniref:hypothetical protein n=1 Tax=Clostridium lacusfryxellense TaxID=205328 RepID=UPI001C0B2025|nr:hypothetical protein [Clostridium lacusfryxellense]MBU3114344.1 hypothetical protein [Clostridium lacusfryxellense]
MKNENSYILQLEAKDIIKGGEDGFLIKKGKKYKATLDYSLESLKLEELFPKKNMFYIKNEKQYTDTIISVKFNYSVKEGNKTIITTKSLRESFYENGFKIQFEDKKKTEEYIRYKRSSGSSREGNCMFIKKYLYKKMMVWAYMDLMKYSEKCNLDLASMEAYISLTTSSIIDTIQIKPENILLIDDFLSPFKDTVMATRIEKINGIDRLVTKREEDVEITNNIWDGQSLICSSLMGKAPDDKTIWVKGKYHDKSMLLLRQRFFKSACFSTNIAKFFSNNNITKLSQLNGKYIATDISQIKLITTKSSIKYLKFNNNIMDYLSRLESIFGIVKYDKPTHYFKGKYVQSHYQLLNTLQLDYKECERLLQPSLDYTKVLKQDIRVLNVKL